MPLASVEYLAVMYSAVITPPSSTELLEEILRRLDILLHVAKGTFSNGYILIAVIKPSVSVE